MNSFMRNIQISISIYTHIICVLYIHLSVYFRTPQLLHCWHYGLCKFCWGSREICPRFCMMFISNHGPYQPDVSSTSQLGQPKLLQTLANVSWAKKGWANDLVENHWSVYTHTHRKWSSLKEYLVKRVIVVTSELWERW